MRREEGEPTKGKIVINDGDHGNNMETLKNMKGNIQTVLSA
jgi:hypothetical protein